jgi:CMP-N,N'-diacetyllegionaminic acid synthase
MNKLFIIPARGGSKGIPGKNIKPLGGKPLIQYSIEVARALAPDEDICVSTDDTAIKTVAEATGLQVPFLRPAALATDAAGTYEVLLHALDFWTSRGKTYDQIVLLQPTSPFRQAWQVGEALDAWEDGLEMLVSVKEADANPYYNLFEENADGFLQKSKQGSFSRRQDCPDVYQYNGAIYVMDVRALLRNHYASFKKIKKYLMDVGSSLDLDNPLDWSFAEFLLEKRLIKISPEVSGL